MDDESKRREGILARQIAALAPAFRERLQRDRAELDGLLAELAAAGTDASGVLRRIHLAVHKLHGTSAMFGYGTLGRAAGEVEVGAHAALQAGVPGPAAAANLAAPYERLKAELEAALENLSAPSPP
jgi:hypothetical protein